LAIQNDLLPRLVPLSTTLNDLKRDLAALEPRQTARMQTNAFAKLLQTARGSSDPNTMSALSNECGCEIQVDGGGTVWFVKRAK
jgi:hypothetical protein